MELPNWIQDHIELYRKDPEAGHMWDSTVVGGPGPLPCLLLTTVGRKSGKERTLPLLYTEADGGYVLIASKGGAPKHPAWYLNLQSHPEVKLQVGKAEFTATTETITDDPQRQRLWDEMVKIWPSYEDYQASTDRKIPVVLATPKS